MAVAQGTCPSCGAPIEFSVGSSIAKVCDYCRATVYRTDRGLEDLGKVAAIANTPSLIAVGDEGMLAGRPFLVLGRVQLDHGQGPWDEYYVTYSHGQSWGWLAYAEGMWFATSDFAENPPVRPFGELIPEMDVALGSAGTFRVAEVRTGTIVSAEGELPERFPPGFVRHYADLHGASGTFATIDYGDNTGKHATFVGRWVDEGKMQVTQIGPRTARKVKVDQIRCPSCGGDIPKLSGERAERIGCGYCGAVSDLTSQQIISKQEKASKAPDIPIGSKGTLDNIQYTCIAYVRRHSFFEDEMFAWDEYLLFSEGLGYRWLVKDESSWMWVMPLAVSELDLRSMPQSVGWRGKTFQLRNSNTATVGYVLGELYWKCEVGETTQASDYICDAEVLSRETTPGEVKWSYSAPVPWPLLAHAFALDPNGPGGHFAPPASESTGSGGCGGNTSQLVILIILGVLVFSFIGRCTAFPLPIYMGRSGSSTYGGSGYYYGGK